MYRVINLIKFGIRKMLPTSNAPQKAVQLDAPIPLSKSKVPNITLEDTLYNMGIRQRPRPKNHTFKLLIGYFIAFLSMVYYVSHMTPSTENATRIYQELEEEARKKEKNQKDRNQKAT